MMLNERPPTTQPAMPVHRHAKPKADEAAARPSHSHTDYDLQPLRVNSLDHYVKVATDNRFHVHGSAPLRLNTSPSLVTGRVGLTQVSRLALGEDGD